MLLITLSNLFPNDMQIRHGIFVRERLKHLLAHTEIEALRAVVVAPIPWFPFGLRSELAKLKAVPAHSIDDATRTEVHHPRYLALPLLGNITSPFFYALAARKMIRTLQQTDTDAIIDAHFGFPDGAAAVLLGKWTRLPVVVTHRGSDLNQMAEEPGIRQWVKWALRKADTIVTVSDALRQRALQLVHDLQHICVVRNGVDGELFKPAPDRDSIRAKLDLKRPTLLCVGNLLPLKGHDLVINALASLPDFDLVIVGDGPSKVALTQQIEHLDLTHRVKLVDEISQAELVQYYQAADMLVLASSREGLPNVVLECMSCGTPVIATNVGGVSEVLKTKEQGVLLEERSSEAIVRAVTELQARSSEVSAATVQRSVAEFHWRATVQQLDSIFGRLKSAHSHR